MTRLLVCALTAALAACGPDSPADGTAADGMTTLTVAGEIADTNRGGFDAERDAYFAWLGVTFDAAYGFTRADLAAMPQHALQASIEGASSAAFEGPLLADVLAAAGAEADAEAVLATALDGYSAQIPIEAAQGAGAIVALSRNGEALPLGGTGPAMIVFPDDAGVDAGWYVWGLVLIAVE